MSISVGLTGGENLVALIAYACLRLHKLAFYPRCIDIIVLTAANNTFLTLIYIYKYTHTVDFHLSFKTSSQRKSTTLALNVLTSGISLAS